MKKLFLIVPLLLLCSCAHAATVKFAWTYSNPVPTGFEMRITDGNGAAILTQDCGAAPTDECLIPAIPAGSYKAQCFAYQVGSDNIREYSDGSNILPFIVPAKPANPITFKIK